MIVSCAGLTTRGQDFETRCCRYERWCNSQHQSVAGGMPCRHKCLFGSSWSSHSLSRQNSPQIWAPVHQSLLLQAEITLRSTWERQQIISMQAGKSYSWSPEHNRYPLLVACKLSSYGSHKHTRCIAITWFFLRFESDGGNVGWPFNPHSWRPDLMIEI